MRVRGMLLTAALLMGAVVSPAFSAPIIDWDPAMFWEPGATYNNSPNGNELQIVGTVSAFGPPLEFLNANMPAKEYTFYAHGLISGTTQVIGPVTGQFYITPYAGGTIEIYEDSSTPAVFTANPPNGDVPGTFTDGTLILSGSFNSFSTQTNNITPHQTGNAEGAFTWTGGTLISFVGGDNPCPGLFTGGLTWWPDPNLLPPGYLFRHDGKIDDECPTPARPGTWGRIKTLYR
jgi:hypothetical protein